MTVKESKALSKLVMAIAKLRAQADILAVWSVSDLLGQAGESALTLMRVVLEEEKEGAILGPEGEEIGV